MTRVLVDDPDLARHLLAARSKVEVCDASGLVLGFFVPAVLVQDSDPTLPPPESQRGPGADDTDFWTTIGIE